MTQPDLFTSLSDPSEQAVKVRRNARPTSAAAGRAALPRSGTQRMRVLVEIAKVPSTDDEIIVRTGLAHQSIGPRRLELEEGGWIEDSGETRLTRMQKPAIVWQLTASARLLIEINDGTIRVH